MNIKTLDIILDLANPKRAVLLKGCHGIGKTDWVSQLAAKWNLKLVIWHASHAADPGDITGFPKVIKEILRWTDEAGEVHEEEHEVMAMCPPKWMVQKEPVLLLLDEINRGLNVTMNALMQLTNSQSYDDIKLPEGSRIFACVNPAEDGNYIVNSMDAAQLSRFDIYDFTPSWEEWVEWAQENNIHKSIIDFITCHPRFLDPNTNEELIHSVTGKDCVKLPDRRAWATAVSVFVTNGERNNLWNTPEGINILLQGVAGMVGDGAAEAYVDFFIRSKKMINPIKFLNKETLSETVLNEINKIMAEDITVGISFIKSCTMYLESNLTELIVKTELAKRWVNNLYNVINQLLPDVKVTVVSDVIYNAVTEHKAWAKAVLTIKPEFKDMIREARSPVLF